MAGLLTALSAAWGLTGCAFDPLRQPVVLYVALSSMEQEPITREISRQFHDRIREMVAGFRRVHPNVLVQIVVYPENQLVHQIGLRTRSGLGPDLIITSADHANALLERGLVDPMPVTTRERQAIDPQLLQRVQDRRGRLAALPLLIQPQLACFDRRRQPRPIGSIAALSQRSASGLRVGLALRLEDLIWTAGSFGAVPALQAAASGSRPDPQQRRALQTWLEWLQNSSGRQRFQLQPDNDALRSGLRQGALDWISCRSSDLPALQRALGPHLGIATLPGGTGQPALQIRPLRVVALARNSSPRQRQLAIALSHHSVRPQVQRNFVLQETIGIPANRHAALLLGHGEPLETMQQALQQEGDTATLGASLLAELTIDDPRLKRLQETLTSVVFGVIDPPQAERQIVRLLRGEDGPTAIQPRR